MSPRDLLHLLWDNSRTSEYNDYCLGRTDVVVLDGQQVLEAGAHAGTKIIQSETRVPFTGMSVFMNCLMHVREMQAPDQGYVIVSRSLAAGAAGNHARCSNAAATTNNKNEIVWGVNVLRQVPHHPHLTDLTSLSQASSSCVPQFMAYKIGIMGIQDFFHNVRSRNQQKKKNAECLQQQEEASNAVVVPA